MRIVQKHACMAAHPGGPAIKVVSYKVIMLALGVHFAIEQWLEKLLAPLSLCIRDGTLFAPSGR